MFKIVIVGRDDVDYKHLERWKVLSLPMLGNWFNVGERVRRVINDGDALCLAPDRVSLLTTRAWTLGSYPVGPYTSESSTI